MHEAESGEERTVAIREEHGLTLDDEELNLIFRLVHNHGLLLGEHFIDISFNAGIALLQFRFDLTRNTVLHSLEAIEVFLDRKSVGRR